VLNNGCNDFSFGVHCVEEGAVIYPEPPEVTTHQFSCDTPQPSEVQRGLSGGVYGGVYVIVMEGVININKMLTM